MPLKEKIRESAIKSALDFFHSIPILLGGVMLFTLVDTFWPNIPYDQVFKKNIIWDSAIGGALGSILSGESLTSYVLGQEFLKKGVSLVAVTAFIISWVNVSFSQLPIEAVYLGKRFSLFRNLISYIFSIFIAIITVYLL
jgi:uncharacterized membrane protein YraQ (UPF0718 family)